MMNFMKKTLTNRVRGTPCNFSASKFIVRWNDWGEFGSKFISKKVLRKANMNLEVFRKLFGPFVRLLASLGIDRVLTSLDVLFLV
jgi:hypothetical protein